MRRLMGRLMCGLLFAGGFLLFCGFDYFNAANSAYREGKYDAAIEGYNKLIDSGFESGNVYFNLGNSYFKKGELGKAILNYERARLLIPGDSDLRLNYEYALSAVHEQPAVFGSRFERLCQRFFEGMTTDSLAIFLSVVCILIIVVFTLNLFVAAAKPLTWPSVISLLILFCICLAAFRQRLIFINTGAVVVEKETDIKFEPREDATTFFRLSEGATIEIIEESADWCRVKRPDGKIGWAKRAALETIKN